MSKPFRHYQSPSEQVVVLLPTDDIDSLDVIAKQRASTRSAVIREAVALLLHQAGGGE